MTTKEFQKSISQTAKSMLSKHGLRWSDVVIDRRYPIIWVGDYYFAQGDDADSMLEQIRQIPPSINERSWLLWYLESAGVL